MKLWMNTCENGYVGNDFNNSNCILCDNILDNSMSEDIAEINCAHKHVFHYDCIVKHFSKENNLCPKCGGQLVVYD